LEDRYLLAFDQGTVLQETFDDLGLTSTQLLSVSGWDDTKTIPASPDGRTPPQPTTIPLFHHVVTSPSPGSGTFAMLDSGGTTTSTDLKPQALDLFNATDTITFPSIDPASETVTYAAVDLPRSFLLGFANSVTFNGTNGSVTVADSLPALVGNIPASTVISPSSPSGGPSPLSSVSAPPVVPHVIYDAVVAGSKDMGANGPIGPITSIVINTVTDTPIDNVRIFIGNQSTTPTSTPTTTPSPTPAPPHVTSIVSVQHSTKGLAAIIVTFDQSLSSGSATNPKFYLLLGGLKKRSRTLFTRSLALGRVSLEGNAKVTLTLAKPFKGPVQVTVHGGIEASTGASSSGDVSQVVK
jgi:hypothetical protein